ncbi:hypothetical protein ACOME3_005792 [Neoechinorhynchus agilis]
MNFNMDNGIKYEETLMELKKLQIMSWVTRYFYDKLVQRHKFPDPNSEKVSEASIGAMKALKIGTESSQDPETMCSEVEHLLDILTGSGDHDEIISKTIDAVKTACVNLRAAIKDSGRFDKR